MTLYNPGTSASPRPKATVLSVCRAGGVLVTRNAILKNAGYAVAAAQGLDAALTAINRQQFDVVVIGHLYSVEEKNLIATRARSSGAKVLCMYSEPSAPPVPDATAFIHNLDHPDELLSAIASLLTDAAGAASR